MNVNWNNLWVLIFFLPSVAAFAHISISEYLWDRKQKKQQQRKELGL